MLFFSEILSFRLRVLLTIIGRFLFLRPKNPLNVFSGDGNSVGAGRKQVEFDVPNVVLGLAEDGSVKVVTFSVELVENGSAWLAG